MPGKHIVYVLLLLRWHLSASTYNFSWRLSLTYTAKYSENVCLSRGEIPIPQVTVRCGRCCRAVTSSDTSVCYAKKWTKKGTIQNRACVLFHYGVIISIIKFVQILTFQASLTVVLGKVSYSCSTEMLNSSPLEFSNNWGSDFAFHRKQGFWRKDW